MTPIDGWETTLVTELGDKCWDEATELASMIADEFPSIIDHDVRFRLAAEIVVKLARDGDYRRCLADLVDHYGAPTEQICTCDVVPWAECPEHGRESVRSETDRTEQNSGRLSPDAD